MARLVCHTKSAVGGCKVLATLYFMATAFIGADGQSSPSPPHLRPNWRIQSTHSEPSRLGWHKFGDRRDLNPRPLGLQSSVLTIRPHGKTSRTSLIWSSVNMLLGSESSGSGSPSISATDIIRRTSRAFTIWRKGSQTYTHNNINGYATSFINLIIDLQCLQYLHWSYGGKTRCLPKTEASVI